MTVAILFVVLYGLFKALTDERRDNPDDNWLTSHINQKFYYGGAERGYTQRFPFVWSDFWHSFDDCKLFLLILALLIPLHLVWYKFILYSVFLMWLSGRAFALPYTYLLPDVKKNGSIWSWIINSILFWRGENK